MMTDRRHQSPSWQ